MTMTTINHLLGAQQHLAQAVAAGLASPEDENEVRYWLLMIPHILKRQEGGSVDMTGAGEQHV